MNDNNAISIKPIKDLFGLKFFIPNYQRGVSLGCAASY